MTNSVQDRLAALEQLSNQELKDEFVQLFGVQVKTHNRAFLLGQCSQRIQELELGGLSQLAMDKMVSHLKQRSFSPKTGEKNKWRGGKSKPEELPPVGTTLISKCGNFKAHVAPNGQIDFEGERYPSVTQAAKAAVGKSYPINGRMFWCLPSLKRSSGKKENHNE